VAAPADRTVVATRPGEVEAAEFRFPIVGRVPYKGFFDLAAAEREAESLRDDGLDVCLVGVAAYSTLGWLADPVTEPMLGSDDLELVETLLHELVHVTAYVPSDADFNEGVANFIGREAAARYLGERGLAGDARSAAALEAEQRERNADARSLADALRRFRAEVEALYRSSEPGPERDAERRALESRARSGLARLLLMRSDSAEIAQRIQLGDACLALRGTYSDDLPRHDALLASLGGDLRAFVERLDRAATADAPRDAFFAATR
jgi:predicted aminopeptidase